MKRRWVVGAWLLFIAWKFFLIALLWQQRSVPPEPDDGFIYIGHIYAVIRCPWLACTDNPYVSLANTTGFQYLSYRVVLGELAWLLHLSAPVMFQLSFYVGTVLLVLVLWQLIRQLLPGNELLQLFSLLVMGLFYGGGGYHGFFWVVPSFFEMLLFFALLVYVLSPSFSRWWAVVLAILFAWVHPSSLFLLVLIPLSGILFGFWRRAGLVLVVALVARLTFMLLLPQAELPRLSPAPPPAASQSAVSASAPVSTWFVGLNNLKNDYFNWLFPHWLGIVFFGLVLGLTWSAGYYQLLLLFAVVFFATMAGSFHPEVRRLLIILWPLTYLLYAVGFWQLFWLKPNYFWRAAVALLLFCFVGVNMAYSIAYAWQANQKNRLSIPVALGSYVEARTAPTDSVYYADETIRSFSYTTELTTRPQASSAEEAHYTLALAPPPAPTAATLDRFFAVALSVFKRSSAAPPIQHALSPALPDFLQAEQQFGDVVLYRNTTWKSSL